jgi:transposase
VCEADGNKRQQMRVFGTFTSDLLALADWLKQQGVTHVAMEATGVYWRPVWAILEGQFQQMLVNPQHIKAVPGRKTDAKDCEWIADLLQHGLLKGSFVPPTPIQDLRDLTRYRAELRQSQNRVANRIQKFLEQANLKLSSVASNALGVSGRQMLEAIIAGQDNPEQLAKLARGKLKNPNWSRPWKGGYEIITGSCWPNTWTNGKRSANGSVAWRRRSTNRSTLLKRPSPFGKPSPAWNG